MKKIELDQELSDQPLYDLVVIGGGINGTGIARDAAGRGLKVLLVEQADLAQATSSASSKLIHGGLRYLEYYEFRLVRESLQEREVLLNNAAHIIWPLRFVMPHNKLLRPAWMIRLGLFLYDHLGGRQRLPGSNGIRLDRHMFGQPLAPGIHQGFVYSDCWVQDSRLVVLNAMGAAEKGARILTRLRCTAAHVQNGQWSVRLADQQTDQSYQVRGKMLINAAGPWVDQFIRQATHINPKHRLRLVKGSHIVVPKLYDGEQAYILQNTDRRVIFVIPYEQDFTLVGTTDLTVDPEILKDVRISDDETTYLCQAANQYFSRKISAADVVWSYAGVRPLYDDASANASAVTRDYVLQVNQDLGAPGLSIYGGKITTYRRLAEHVMQKIQPFFPHLGKSWTAKAPLPGGDIPMADFKQFLQGLTKQYSWVPDKLLYRYARAYGTKTHVLLDKAKGLEDLGLEIVPDLYSREIEYLQRYEWAVTAEDILWRRSKLGLHLPKTASQQLQGYLDRTATKQKLVKEKVAG